MSQINQTHHWQQQRSSSFHVLVRGRHVTNLQCTCRATVFPIIPFGFFLSSLMKTSPSYAIKVWNWSLISRCLFVNIIHVLERLSSLVRSIRPIAIVLWHWSCHRRQRCLTFLPYITVSWVFLRLHSNKRFRFYCCCCFCRSLPKKRCHLILFRNILFSRQMFSRLTPKKIYCRISGVDKGNAQSS